MPEQRSRAVLHSEEDHTLGCTERCSRRAWIHFDGWAGRAKAAVVIVGETRTRFRVRYVESFQYGRRVHRAGDVVLVPRRAVTEDEG